MAAMQTLIEKGSRDYSLLASGEGYRLERFAHTLIVRPDPQALWEKKLLPKVWNEADAIFEKSEGDRGNWQVRKPMSPNWHLNYKNLQLELKLSPFKHTGVFPEQAKQWEWLEQILLKNQSKPKILNLFAYTGGASLVCATHGAQVTHVDASKPAITWARQNQTLSHLEKAPIRWILDDAVKFVMREERRGQKYDGIVMDPPAYGHGPTGETWDFLRDFPKLLKSCASILTPKPLFFLINAYAISASALMLENCLADYVGALKGSLRSGELALEEQSAGRLLSTGIYASWERK